MSELMTAAETAFRSYNKAWMNLNSFESDELGSLLTRKQEIEDWFRWHPDSPDTQAMRELYAEVNDKIENINKQRDGRPERTTN